MADFSERLKIALEEKSWNQSELARALGIGRAMISHYLSGRYAPNSIEKIIEIAKILNVSAPWLAGYDAPMDDFSHVVSTKFKDRLNEALNKKGISTNQLAAMTNSNEKNVLEWRQGQNHPDFNTILTISKKINVSMIWLVGCDVPMEDHDKSEEVYHMFEELNESGKKKVVDYIYDLLDSPRYRKENK